jgi:hypothetical protein
MPPHLSHLLQLLDIALFEPLKRAYSKQVEKMTRTSLTRVSKEDFFPAFKNAFFAVFGETNVQSGFQKAGLVPYNPKQVIAKLDIKLRTPTPDIESCNLPEPWVSQTPHNPIEAQLQSIFLKARIVRHQRSPRPLFIRQLIILEDAKMIMHNLPFKVPSLNCFVRQITNQSSENKKKTLKRRIV